MKKRFAAIFLALVVSAFSLTGCTKSAETSSSAEDQSSYVLSEDADSTSVAADEYFAEGDLRDVESEEANAVITLSGSAGELSDTTRGSSGSDVTITSKGIYEITGSSENVTITVNDSNKSGNVYLVLNGVSMNNSDDPCIVVEQSEKVIIVCKGDNNTLRYTNASNTDGLDGAVYSEDDITLTGSGKLSVESAKHGIVCKDDFKLTGSETSVSAAGVGVKASDSARIGSGALEIKSDHDGIQVENKKGDSFFYMSGGAVKVSAGYDGIDTGTSSADFTGSAMLLGGTLDITSGGGSDNSKDDETSQKGIKCDGDITLGGVALSVSSADDAVNSKGNVTVSTGAALLLSTSDDGLTAKGELTINDGALTIDKSYEGIEGASVTINGGAVSVTSSDDGINAGGGSDSASDEEFSEESSGSVTINGGSVYVNSTGDGIDSNGSVYVTDGTLIIEGPTDAGNGAIDKGDASGCTASITGGTVLAIGSSGMAINFDSGSQCSALVSLSGSEGTEIAVNDGSEFTFTASKSFDCVVYSSPDLKQGSFYKLTAGSSSADIDFTSPIYYSDVQTRGGMQP